MDISFLVILFIFGTLFGSFSSVVISRLRSGEGGIMGGRSHCVKCNHTLGAQDLIPIFSWLSTFGKCRYCKTKVSVLYPILELFMGSMFALVGGVLVNPELILMGDGNEIIKLAFLLFITFLTVVFVVYDILYMEIPEEILLLGNISAFLVLIYSSFGGEILTTIKTITLLGDGDVIIPIIFPVLSILTGIIALAGFYTIMLYELKTVKKDLIKDISILSALGLIFVGLYSFSSSFFNIPIISGVFAAYCMFLFFYIMYALSAGRAIGGGDFRIAIFMGLLLGTDLIFLGGFLSYFSGAIISIFFLMYQGYKKFVQKKEGTNMIPFGPFLAIGLFLTLLFHKELLEFYNQLVNSYYTLLF